MKKLLFFFLCVYALPNVMTAQMAMGANGFVGVGPNFTGVAPRYPLDIDCWASFSCNPSTSGFYFQNYHNLWAGTWYDEPIIEPQWGNSAWLGNSSVPFWRVYSNQVWASDGIIHQSDQRLKTNIKSYSGALDRVRKMNPVSYDLLLDSLRLPGNKKSAYDKAKLRKIGFVAQELKDIVPEAVVFDEGRKIYGIDYAVVIPVLVQAMKEQQNSIDSLKKIISKQNSSLKSGTVQTSSSSLLADNIDATLEQNIPNPFNQATVIGYYLPESVKEAFIYIFDMNGKQIRRLSIHEKGNSSLTINGSELRSGMYFYTLIADGKEIDTKRMILTE